MQIRVYYEDTDTGGIVYHSNYLNFCERARSQVFFDRGMKPYLEEGHFVARKITAEYFKSAKLGDLLDIKTELTTMKSASFTLKQTVYREDEKLFELEILLAYISFEGRIKKIDQDTKDLILELFSL